MHYENLYSLRILGKKLLGIVNLTVNHLHGTITALVPRGSVTGSLFSMIYTHDLPDAFNSNIKSFVEESSLFVVMYLSFKYVMELSKKTN